MALVGFVFQWILRFSGGDPVSGVGPVFSLVLVGWLFLGFRVLDAASNPVTGALCDAWVRRGKERRTLLWGSFWLPTLGMLFMFSPVSSMSAGVRWPLLVGGMFVFFAGCTLYSIPYWSLVDDYSGGDAGMRRRLSSVQGAGSLLGTALCFVVSPILVDRLGFRDAALCFGIPAGALMLLPYFAAPPRGEVQQARTANSNAHHVAPNYRAALRHRRFVAAVLLLATGQMSLNVLTAAVPYIVVLLLGGGLSDVTTLLGPFLLAAVPCFIFVPRLSAAFGWERALVGASLVMGVACSGIGALGGTLFHSPLATGMLLFALTGPLAAVLIALPGEAITSCARERQGEVTSAYFGLYSLVLKGLNGLAVALTALLASAIRTHGTLAVRAMGYLAGALLLGSVVLYMLTRAGNAGAISQAVEE